MEMDDAQELRARVAALEFAIGIERADTRRRALVWALAYETAAPVQVRPEVTEYVAERLRGVVRMAIMAGPKSVASLVAATPAERAKEALFESYADPAEARSAVDTLALCRTPWTSFGLPHAPNADTKP
jgi:hypothetical protein